VSGEALAVIMLSNTLEGGVHPAHIHANSAAEGGGILFSFNPINGTTGISKTNVAALNDGSAFTYADIEPVDGYINVHLSAEELGTLVAQGDIGQNILTGSSVVYNLGAVAVETISGTATFHERVSGEALAVIMLSNTLEGGSHPAHIHANSAAVGGGILFSFNPINGTTGMSKTNLAALNDGSTFVYADIETVDGYINVHLSADELGTLVAQGNIGINEGTETENINFDITNSGSSSYIFNGGGFTNAEDPAITLKRGETYTLTLNAPSHPFLIKTDQSTGSGSTYNDGVTNNGAATGTITFTVPASAPATLFYVCEFHGSMTGTITITD
jgi:plastocyanin